MQTCIVVHFYQFPLVIVDITRRNAIIISLSLVFIPNRDISFRFVENVFTG